MHTARRIGAAIVIGTTALVFGGVGVFGAAPSPRSEAEAIPAAEALLRPSATGSSLTRTIDVLRSRLRERPDDPRSLAALGLAYVQHARMAADAAPYAKAEAALERSLALQPEGNHDATVGLGALALARHDFAEALDRGRAAVALDPYDGPGHGVVGDALLELGRYREAFDAFQRMVDVSPDLSSYARVSYARQLTGDLDGALEAMELALGAAGTPEDAAWASHQLGDLLLADGRPLEATTAYRRAIFLAPSFLPPRAGLATVAWIRGRTDHAVRALSRVVRRAPFPEYVIALGDLYTVTGRRALAEDQYELARAQAELQRAGGVNVGLELALFEAEHGSPRRALIAAREEWSQRRSVHVADALAWALYVNGEYREAEGFSRLALRLGSEDPLFLYHAAKIQMRLGDETAAHGLLSRVRAINPSFSILHADDAARLLARLEARR